MMRLDDLEKFSAEHNLKLVTIADLIAYRRGTEHLVSRAAGPIDFPTKFGHFNLYVYETAVEKDPYVAIVKGDVATDENHYSKRAILAGILTGAFAIRLSSGRQAALQFVDRRIGNVMA